MAKQDEKNARSEEAWDEVNLHEQKQYTIRRNIEVLVQISKTFGFKSMSLEEFGLKDPDEKTKLNGEVVAKLSEFVSKLKTL